MASFLSRLRLGLWLIALPLLLGVLCYLCWRPTTLFEIWLAGHWPTLGAALADLRHQLALPWLPLLSPSLADFCWAFALAATLVLLGQHRPWLALLVAASAELAQRPGWLPGTFDWLDLAALLLAVLLAHPLSLYLMELSHEPMENPGIPVR
ncbi:hypothetical protein [Gallaecimonas xiamenensis]|uniref:Uncharacterized protein n=1 Tax=Gallaecimonas xiamenensis 3-C-1 TaxID=745411 RepID=K2JQ43_9GAMM|nr:hypothetical protein [Gallaecimonas xiamenensis]EKE77408.1 hypothetical protein B3C1_01315 [Gallaecimonas xiamenensis 3-C-1]